MSKDRVIEGDHVPLIGSTLALIAGDDGMFAVFDLSEPFGGPQFIMDREALTSWARLNTEANMRVRGESRPYNADDISSGINARLVSDEFVVCEYQRHSAVCCVWLRDDPSLCFDFNRTEANSLVAFFGTPEFTDYMVRQPTVST